MDPDGDYSEVVRPRVSSLLTKTRTRDSEAHVWTTFSADQVDLNWQNPEVFFEFLDILFLYLSKGMRVARLDAVAFLWKTLGTNCIHLPETHEMVKLFRDICEIVAPQVLLMTETNVPHEENVSYFGNGDEAHMVYQFEASALAPCIHDGRWFVSHEVGSELSAPPPERLHLPRLPSHDGIGVRPIEGILPTKGVIRSSSTSRRLGDV